MHWHEFLLCLERGGFRGEKMISSQTSLLYSYALWLIGRVDHEVPLSQLRETIARWFFMAQLTGRYSGSVETQMEQDLALLRDLRPGDAYGFTAALDRVVQEVLTHDFWTITLPRALDSSASKSPALLAHIAALNILDADVLLSTIKVCTRLDPAITAVKGVERHHLFPRKYLQKSLGVTSSTTINQIANMALLEWNDNIAISDQAPQEYWPRQLAAKGMASETRTRQLYLHALPEDWPSLEFDAFLTARRQLMAQVIKDAFFRLGDSTYQPVYPEAAAIPRQPAPTAIPSRRIKLSELLDAGWSASGQCSLPHGRDTTTQQPSTTRDASFSTVSSTRPLPELPPRPAQGPTDGLSGSLTPPTARSLSLRCEPPCLKMADRFQASMSDPPGGPHRWQVVESGTT